MNILHVKLRDEAVGVSTTEESLIPKLDPTMPRDFYVKVASVTPDIIIGNVIGPDLADLLVTDPNTGRTRQIIVMLERETVKYVALQEAEPKPVINEDGSLSIQVRLTNHRPSSWPATHAPAPLAWLS